MGRFLVLHAFAKVNLHLDIGPRRSNGYHDLQTVFQQISLHDTLRFSLRNDGQIILKSHQKKFPLGADNIIVKALLKLQSHLKLKQGINVWCKKRIPMGAGLGGGSTDAATALWGGWMLWTKKKKPRQVPPILMKMALELGADVPFFLKGGTAWAEGVGEKLKRISFSSQKWLVLIYPDEHVSTPLAYKLFDQANNQGRFHWRKKNFSWARNEFKKYPHTSFLNSFEPVVFKKFPKVKKAFQLLQKAGCKGVRMSGSGSCVFGIVSSKKSGEEVLNNFKKENFLVFVTNFRVL
ncbi:MAG: 4-(cytidine 5'-diphospho)-2-C-methyl-D-erythritol kinase [Elusimicrobiota bacterium]